MTHFRQDDGHVPVLSSWPGAVRWSWFGEFLTSRTHVQTEREVREARRRAAQSAVERLTR